MPTRRTSEKMTAERGQEPLRVAGRCEPSHCPLPLAGRLMGNPGPIVHIPRPQCSANGVISRCATRQLPRLSVNGARGTYHCPFNSFRKNRLAAVAFRLDCTDTSRTVPCLKNWCRNRIHLAVVGMDVVDAGLK